MSSLRVQKGKEIWSLFMTLVCYKCMGLYTHTALRVFIIGAQLLFLCNGRYAAFIRISLLSKNPRALQIFCRLTIMAFLYLFKLSIDKKYLE